MPESPADVADHEIRCAIASLEGERIAARAVGMINGLSDAQLTSVQVWELVRDCVRLWAHDLCEHVFYVEDDEE